MTADFLISRKLSWSAPYFYGEGVSIPEQSGDTDRLNREPSGLLWEPNGLDEVAAKRGGQGKNRQRLSSKLRRRGDFDDDVAGSGAIEMRAAHVAVTLDLSGS